MTFTHVMSVLIGIGGAVSTFLFRRGGIYNPTLEPLVTPQNSPVATSTPPKPTPQPPTLKTVPLEEIAKYMRDFEGKPGDANWKNNNPLNCRFFNPSKDGTDNDYLPMYRPVKCSPNTFAIFKDYDTGWKYAMNMLRYKIRKHPNWTLYDLIENHAPEEDSNDPFHYTRNVAKRAGVDNSFPVKNIV